MFITCQECNTTFRLDENLLKPTGSKVRCSQCRHMFVAYPPAPQPAEPADTLVQMPPVPAAEPPLPEPQAVPEEAQGLEGIDLAELDSLLEGDALRDTGPSAESESDLAESAAGDELPELDESDLELDFDAALALDAEEQPVSAEETAGQGEEIDLDMDFSLEDEPQSIADQPAQAAAEIDEALSLGADLEPAEPEAGADLPELGGDLDLDLEGLTADADEAAGPSDITDRSGDDLDLGDLDFDLSDAPAAGEPAEEEPELSLAEDLDLLPDEAGAEAEAEIPSHETEAAEQDLQLDIDFGDERQLEPEQDLESGAPQFEEPELELAMASDQPGDKGGDDLDLSDLDDLLGSGDKAAGPGEEASEGLDLELDLDDASAGEGAAAAPEEDLEDLEFELDSEFTDSPEMPAEDQDAIGETIDEHEEIDLSDIEQMLEGGDVVDRTPKPAEAFESDLDLDLGGDEGEIDLADIESAIDAAESAPVARAGDRETEEPELELDLDLGGDEPKKGEVAEDLELDLTLEEDDTAKDDLELDLDLELEGQETSAQEQVPEVDDSELDLSDLSELVEEPKKKTETISSGDIELEFEIEDDTQEPAPAARELSQTARQSQEISVEEALAVPLVEEESKPAKPAKPVKPKKKTSKSLVVLFILILLGGIGYGAYYAVTQLGIEIPYLSQYIKPQPQDPAGTLNLSTLEINSKFIENSASGRLFVITGKVRNGYSVSRERVRLQGKLYTKGKVLVKTEYSYAGILLDDQELATLPIEQIKQRLTAVSQTQAASTVVRAGQNVSFMVVFSDLPPAEELDEFAIELLSSVQAQ